MNNELPLISVALATYNGEKFLREQLDSIYAQTCKNIEVIACDDCSSDGTVNILDEYSQKFGLKCFKNEINLGFVKNFEKAITLCTGDYIALCDQDDVWNPNKLEVLIQSIGDSDLIFADAEIIDENGRIIFNSFKDYISVKHPKENQFARLLYGNYIYGASMFFKSSLKNAILPFPEKLPYHDMWIGLAAAANDKIKFEGSVLNKYRLHGNNNTGISNLSDFKNKLKFHCNDEDLRDRKRLVYIKLIELARFKFTKGKCENELEKAEKYHRIILNKKHSMLFRIYRMYYLLRFSLKSKYIFEPDMPYPIYLFRLFEHFFVTNIITKKLYSFFERKATGNSLQ
jgi:glycosyltransferase involved in cell wall biosynthesis